MKFAQLILPLALLGLFSLKLSQAANETSTTAPISPDFSNSDPLSTSSDLSTSLTPEDSYSDYSDYGGGPKRFSGNIRYTAVRRIRKSNTGGGTGTGAASRRGNRNANRNRNRRGNRNANRNRNRKGRGKKRHAPKGRRSNGKRRANNRRNGAPVIRVG